MLIKSIGPNGEVNLTTIRSDATLLIDIQTNCSGHCIDCGVVENCRKIDEMVYGPKEEVKCDGYCVLCTAARDCMKIKRSISTGYHWPSEEEKKDV